jgi:hypothetical protein
MNHTLRLRNVLGACLIGLASSVSAAENAVTLDLVEKWSDLFADAPALLHYAVRSPETLEGQTLWSLSVNRRVVARGEIPIKLDAGKAAELAVPLRVPPIKEGIVVEAQLTLSVIPRGAPQAVATHVKPLWLFGKDPFVDRTEWLKRLNITLFDPDGKTADVFDRARIPVKYTRNGNALGELHEGLLIVGERCSWKDHRALPAMMLKAAEAGVPVLCLAPADGSMPFPGSADAVAPRRMVLKRHEAITELDKRLDAQAWPTDGRAIASRLAFRAEAGRVVLQVADDEAAWPWVEAVYAGRGRIVVCGFGLIAHWESGPAPRFLLAEILNNLDRTK